MAEQNVQITPGTGAGIDTVNVGTGAVGSGSEALRQVVTIGDGMWQANTQSVDDSGTAAVRAEVLDSILLELQRIRLGISILIRTDLSKENKL